MASFPQQITDGHLLWSPSPQLRKECNLTRFNQWLQKEYGFLFTGYQSLWKWSVDHPAAFWESIWNYFNIKSYSPYQQVMSANPMPETRWFEGATLNYAEHIFRNKTTAHPALLFSSERHKLKSVSWKALEEQTAALQSFLKQAGIKPGDRIAAYLPNIPQATVSLLATLSLGAVWSSCSPDFGTESVMDRFKQIEPKILIVVEGYSYNGNIFDRREVVKEIIASLPSLEKVILVPYLNNETGTGNIKNAISWDEVMQTAAGKLLFTPVPFSHPIWILYSSGTTGIPKAITHSHGGMLLEHLKYLSLHNDVRQGERFFWFSTTGWMMWNFVQASLLTGATAVLYDGSPAFPDLNILWKLAKEADIHHFGTSAPFILACMQARLEPGKEFDLHALRSIGSTGSPLPPEGFEYVYEKIKKEVWLCSMSGGTDICTAWVGGCPWRPVYEGEIQCRCLGTAMFAFDEEGNALEDEIGEMVVTRPIPCMPVFFWNDANFERYRASYFEMYPGVWQHGDWIRITAHDGVIILGRSDATLNRQGVRIGTAEVYRAMNKIEEIKDSLIVNIELPHGKDYMPLFVIMKEKETLTPEIQNKIKRTLRSACSPRHVPDAIIEVKDIPYTISGKKMEAPVKKILMGKPPEKAANKGAMRNPDSLDFFAEYFLRRKA